MQTYSQRKFKLFPYAHSYKKMGQMWSPLLKMSKAQKSLYQRKNRFFSMEYRRSLPKRLFWQMALPTLNSYKQLKLSLTMQHSWPRFRAIFFGKMWMFKNPSLVPGVVWPVKSKKYLCAKMHASNSLTHLAGKVSQKWVTKALQKLWTLSSPTQGALWSVAGGMDSLMPNLLVKTGWVNTLAGAYHVLGYNKVKTNGVLSDQSRLFAYPGDFLEWNNPFLLVKVLNGGPEKQVFVLAKAQPGSIHALKIFGWLASFYQKGHSKNLSKKIPWKGKPIHKKVKQLRSESIL